jgi:superfamily I DNA/RNA helicase
VFIAGCEDGLIPLKRPGASVDLAEERRLFYVGMTRASQALYLCASRGCGVAGEKVRPSPFIGDISAGLRVDENPSRSGSKRPRQTQMSLF